jgi:class 3 adenylate cyclase/tetratricopeptide (TPR) repeat protein
MHCSKCGSENPADNNFCAGCGNALTRPCAKCGAENPATSNFCGKCGAPLEASASTPPSEIPPVQTRGLVGERRHLTVLFCDLAGSTAIAAQLDPEEWRETVAGYHRTAAEAITRFDGHVAKYLGDGVMAYFGWPAAHDNDAERATRAGLALLDAIAKLNEQPGHAKLSARVGIDSGAVVVGKGAGSEADVFGDAPNIAARVQSAAEPGSVAISDATHRLIAGLFVVEDRGAQALKGLERPLQLYRVVRPSGMRGRFPAMAAMRGMTPFIGREDELRLLMNRWERVREGEGQVVTIIGEAGIGKSRLVQRFREEIAADPNTWLECATAPFFRNTPFYAIADMLQQSFHWDASHDVDQRLAALQASLGLAGLDPNEAVPLIAPLLELPVGTRYPPMSMAPELQRKRLLATLVAWTFGAAKAQPLVIATEDLHRADHSTLELTQLAVEQGAKERLLLLYTARPEFHAPWPMRAHHTQINLNRLTSRNVRTMVAQVAAKIALSDETVATVVERTGGIPLFVEELTRAVLESGDAKLTGREIPATLHDSLMARLDRLGTAKEVIQISAVIGSEFSYELLRAVHPIGEAELQAALRTLTDAELLYVRGIAPDATYQFKHALIRDAAYEALLKSRRKDLHRTVARTIDEKFPALKEAHPEVLARHWTEAGETGLAIIEWQRAGERATKHRAYHEGEQHYRNAIALLHTLPESPELGRRELTLQLTLGETMGATRGYSSAERSEAFARARVLAERAGDSEALLVVFGLCGAAHTRGQQRSALALADQALEISTRIGTSAALTRAYYWQGLPRFHMGDLTMARQHFVQSLKLYREEDFIGSPIPADPGLCSLVFGGQNEWVLGYPEIALRQVRNAIALARHQNSPAALAFTLSISTGVHGLRGDYKGVIEVCDEAVRLAFESGLPQTNAIVNIWISWARAQIGESTGAVERIRESLAELDVQQFYLARASFLRLLGETQLAIGAIDDALVSVELALQTNPDELLWRSGALILRGELRLRTDAGGKAHFDLAEQDFREAIALAQTMSAKSWELRATTSLARLLRDTGRREEARTMLAEIYSWFTEGFDTADLIEAKALLDELAN